MPLYLPLAVTVNVGEAADEEAGETPGVVVVQLHDVALLSWVKPSICTAPPLLESMFQAVITGGVETVIVGETETGADGPTPLEAIAVKVTGPLLSKVNVGLPVAPPTTETAGRLVVQLQESGELDAVALTVTTPLLLEVIKIGLIVGGVGTFTLMASLAESVTPPALATVTVMMSIALAA